MKNSDDAPTEAVRSRTDLSAEEMCDLVNQYYLEGAPVIEPDPPTLPGDPWYLDDTNRICPVGLRKYFTPEKWANGVEYQKRRLRREELVAQRRREIDLQIIAELRAEGHDPYDEEDLDYLNLD